MDEISKQTSIQDSSNSFSRGSRKGVQMIKISQYYRKIDKHAILRHVTPITILVIIALITYWRFCAPVLYSDDWSLMIGRWYFGNLKWFDLTDLRPLLKARLVILHGIFGLNVHAFYIVLDLLNLLNIILLYFIFESTHQLFGGDVVKWQSALSGADRLWLTVMPGFTGLAQVAVHEEIEATYPLLMVNDWGSRQLYLYDLRETM